VVRRCVRDLENLVNEEALAHWGVGAVAPKKTNTHKKLFSNSGFLGAVAKLRKAILSFVMYICPSVRPSAGNISVPTGRISMNFDIGGLFENLLRKFQFH